MKDKKQQLGFSLVELMVGMVIGLLVSGIIITVFTQSKRNYNQDEEIAKLQENGRYTLQLLTRELSMAGFTGTMNIIDPIDTTVTGSITANPCDAALANWNKVAVEPIIYTVTTPSCIISGVKPNTDILVIKHAVGASTDTLLSDTLYLRTNGEGYSIVANTTATPSYTYWKYVVRIYYIKQANNEDVPTLRRAQLKSDMSWSDEELVQGIENFKITFGIDSTPDGTVDLYKTLTSGVALTNDELRRSIMAKVDVLVRSINKDQNYTNNKTYFAGSTAITNTLNNTQYYGRVFSSTAAMRNIRFKNTY